jgi:hypothetical protein
VGIVRKGMSASFNHNSAQSRECAPNSRTETSCQSRLPNYKICVLMIPARPRVRSSAFHALEWQWSFIWNALEWQSEFYHRAAGVRLASSGGGESEGGKYLSLFMEAFKSPDERAVRSPDIPMLATGSVPQPRPDVRRRGFRGWLLRRLQRKRDQ